MTTLPVDWVSFCAYDGLFDRMKMTQEGEALRTHYPELATNPAMCRCGQWPWSECDVVLKAATRLAEAIKEPEQ